MLKVHGPIFLNLASVSFEESSLQRCEFKNFSWNGQAVWKYEAILYIAVAYILNCVSFIMVTITGHIVVSIVKFQIEHFSAFKFVMGYEKNMSYLVIAKSPKVWKK